MQALPADRGRLRMLMANHRECASSGGWDIGGVGDQGGFGSFALLEPPLGSWVHGPQGSHQHSKGYAVYQITKGRE